MNVRYILRLLSIGCILPGLFHIGFGVSGDWLIGLSPTGPIDPSLDSQNRFYGGIFVAYGLALWVAAADPPRYAPIIRALLGMMFLAGLARGFSAAAFGWPTPEVILLWATELLVPAALCVLLNRSLRDVPSDPI